MGEHDVVPTGGAAGPYLPPPPPLAPPGWYPDPWHVAAWRYFDGAAWSGYTDRVPPPTPAGHPRPPATARVPADRINGFAIASLCCMPFAFAGGFILAIIFGHIALGQIKRSGGRGRGLAEAGLVLGYGWPIVGIGLLILVPTLNALTGG